ncbi:MAG TPA: zinc-binding alcohol dehydrogenase [Flavobacteriales bacterium]|nr:zinc-binding alcohol dehydrogenase [Flavobacteriales bacterium]
MKVMRPWLVAPRTIEYREQEIHLTPNTVLVKHVCTAPSQGTAVHRYLAEEIELDSFNRQKSGGPFPYPWLQGFAYGVGRIEEVGAKVQLVKKGQLIYSQKLTADLSVLDPSDLIPLPEGLDPESAAMLLQAEVGLKGARAAKIILGDTVLVTGQGPIGNFAAQLCKLTGAYQVVVSDLSDLKLQISLQMDIDLALNPRTKDMLNCIEEFTHGQGADVVVESSGSPEAFLQGCGAAAGGGRIVILGWILDSCRFNMSEAFTPKGLEMVVCHAGQLGDWQLARRRLRSRGMRGDGLPKASVSLNSPLNDDYLYLMDLITQGKLKAKELITHRFPINDLVQVWDEFIKPSDTSVHGEYAQILFTSDNV